MDFANQNHKRTRTKILENLTLLENRKANEAKPILQTQLARTFAEKRHVSINSTTEPILRTYKTNRELCRRK